MPEIPKQSKNKPILLALLLMLLIAAGVGVVYKFFPPHVEPRNLSGPIGIVVSRKAQLAGPVQDFPVFHGDAALTGYVDADLPDKPDVLWHRKISEGLPIKSSPVVGGGRVYVGSYDDNLYALNFKDGSVAWKGETGGSIDGSPCYAEGKVFVGSGDHFVYAFDAKDGKLLWKFETGDGIKGGTNYVDGKIIVGSYDNKLYCFDAKAAKVEKPEWSFETSNKINGTPAIANGKTVFGGCDAMLHVLSIKDGSELNKGIDAGAVVAASPALDSAMAFVGTHEGEFIAADLDKGSILWTFKSPKEMAFDSSPALSKDFAVVGCDDKLLHCLHRANGNEAWNFPAKGKISSSPVIAKDRIIVGDEKGRVYILDLKDGAEIWNYELGAPIDTSPAIANNVFIFGADDGSVTAFGKKE
ncbi:MAG TPA: PQQ-binding-like beta-propeller repeat protein [Planctomycetota bacterium]|nr:PQQ-binding-like beta-propeller repeat protein [Planctomycetota bacterium]